MALLTISLLALFNTVKSNNLTSVKFYQTHVIEDKAPFPPVHTLYVKSRLECSTICSRDMECRKYLYCEANGNKICDTFLDGEDCIAGPNQGRCSCYRKGPQSDGVRCHGPIGYYGSECQNIIKDCYEGMSMGMPNLSLSYIQPNGSQRPFEVFCDRGYTIIQRQSKLYEPVNFNRSWSDYVEGFGRKHSGHWIGMDKITKILSNNYRYNLTFVLIDANEFYCYTTFMDFGINQTNNYSFSGTLTFSNSPCFHILNINFQYSQFSTYDHGVSNNCALAQGGGWWFQYPYCSNINLNGNLSLVTSRPFVNGNPTDESAMRLERMI